MQSLKQTEVKSIEQFFQLRQASLRKVLYHFLKSKYEIIYYTEDYIVAIGDIPVALVAHLDTVFTIPPENIFYDRIKNVMWSPDGLGADDRAGVYSIIQIIKQGLKPTIIFTTEEEKGAIGASKLVEQFPNPPVDLKYIIELDRRGSIDCVFYECDNAEFEQYVESYGFITNFGSFSDISVICPAWKVAGVNLSIGYVDEHSYNELLYIGHMFATIKRVVKMLQEVNEDTPAFEYVPMVYERYLEKLYPEYAKYMTGWGFDTCDSGKENKENGDSLFRCHTCGTRDFDYNLFYVKQPFNKPLLLCADCISKDPNVGWCIECGEPFVAAADDKEKKYCFNCKGPVVEVKTCD